MKPKPKKEKTHLQTTDSQDKGVSGAGAQPTTMQLRLETDKPRIRSSQGSVSQNFNSSSGRPPMSKRGDSVSQSSKKEGSAAKEKSAGQGNRRSSKMQQNSKDGGGTLKASDSAAASKKVFSSNQLLEPQNDDKQLDSRSNIGPNQKLNQLHKQQSSSLNNLNSKTIAGDISQNAAGVNISGLKKNAASKKDKNSASRAKESISKLSEKKGTKKDATKKASKDISDNVLAPPETLALDMTPNKQRSSSAKNTKRSASPKNGEQSVNRFDGQQPQELKENDDENVVDPSLQLEEESINLVQQTSPVMQQEDENPVASEHSARSGSNKGFDDFEDTEQPGAQYAASSTQNEIPQHAPSQSQLEEENADAEADDDDDDPGVEPDTNTNIAEKFRIAMKQTIMDHPLVKMNPSALMPPPEELIKKSAIDDEPVKTGAPISFIKQQRLFGKERVEKMNADNPNRGQGPPPDATVCTDIAAANTINDYLINAKEANRLVYCRLGEKYVQDLEKRKNSNLIAINQPTSNLSSASYLINIKKLIEEHNIDGERRDFKSMKTQQMGKTQQATPQQYYKPTGPDDRTLIFESRFESGNLLAAIKLSDNEYDLILQNDINTNGNTQWYFFRVSNTYQGQKVRFNMLNLAKPDSLYNYGMKILCFSNKLKADEGVGWHRVGENINYYQNIYRRENNRFNQRLYYTFTFSRTFSHTDDQQFFAHCFPYTYSDLQEDLSRIERDANAPNFYYRGTLTRTLAGNKCEYLSITSKDKDPKSVKAMSKKGIFLSARVHPGESNASWMMKGVLDFLTSNAPEARALRDNFVFKIVPILNPDGVINGNYRCSLSGQDLNRRWKAPNKVLHPVNFAVKKLIRSFQKEREITLYCDLHGHSRRKNIFMYGNNIKEHPHSTRVFPYIMSKLCDYFSFEQCRFSMSKGKDGTARIAMFKELNISNIFTMEASFCGADRGKYKDQHFTTEYLMLSGRRLLESLIVYCKIDVKQSINTMKKKDGEEDDEKPAYQDINALALEKELTQNKNLIKITMGCEGASSGSDSEPSADNLEDDEMAKIVPIKTKPKPLKPEKKPLVPAPKKIVTLMKQKPQSPNAKRQPPMVKEISRSPTKQPYGGTYNRLLIRKRKPEMKDAWTQTTPKSKEQQERERREHRQRKYAAQQQMIAQQQLQQQQMMLKYQQQMQMQQHRGSINQFSPQDPMKQGNPPIPLDPSKQPPSNGQLTNIATRYQNQLDQRGILNNTLGPNGGKSAGQKPSSNITQDSTKSQQNPTIQNSFQTNPGERSSGPVSANTQSKNQLDASKNVSDSGQNPQPQIRIRTDPFKQKPSNDLAKFEERLLTKNDPPLTQGENPNVSYQTQGGPQHGSSAGSKYHRGSSKKLPQIQSSGSDRKTKMSTQNSMKAEHEYQLMQQRQKLLNQTQSNGSSLMQSGEGIHHQRQISGQNSAANSQFTMHANNSRTLAVRTQYKQGFNNMPPPPGQGQPPQQMRNLGGPINPNSIGNNNPNGAMSAGMISEFQSQQKMNLPYSDMMAATHGLAGQRQQTQISASPNKLRRLPINSQNNSVSGGSGLNNPQSQQLPLTGTQSAQSNQFNQNYGSALAQMNYPRQPNQSQQNATLQNTNVISGRSPGVPGSQNSNNQNWQNHTIQQQLNDANKNIQNSNPRTSYK